MSDRGNMQSEKDKWSNLMCQTISALCRNGMIGYDVIKVQGLIGITLCNNEVFLVEVSECFEANVPNQADVENPLSLRAKSRKRKSNHPRSSRLSGEVISQDAENNEADYNMLPSVNIQIVGGSSYPSESLISNNYFDKVQLYESNGEKVDFSTFDTKDEVPIPVMDLASLATDDPMVKEIESSQRKVKMRRQFSHGVAMTKHTAELLGYQEFSPSSSRPYTCRLCEASFSKKFCLANHIVTVHQVGGKYICEHCGRQFLQRNRYMIHLDRHNDASKLICPNCGKITLKSNFETHLKKCCGTNRREAEPGNFDGADEEERAVGDDSSGLLPRAKIKQEEYESETEG